MYTGKWVYYHLLHFLKDTTTPRTSEGNVSDENEMQLHMYDLSDSEEVNSFSSSFIDTEDIPSPENPVSVPELSFTIQSTSNLSHDNISTSISNDSDTSFRKPCAIKRKKKQEKTSFESELLKLENQKINMLLESNKPQLQDDEDMMFLKSLHPYFKNMDNLQKLQVRNKIQTVLINELSTNKQQHQNEQVSSVPTHELYIPQHTQLQMPANSTDNPTFIGYQQY